MRQSRMHLRLSVSILLLVSLAGCGGGFTNPSKNVTDTFNGTIQPGLADSHDFSVSKNGEYTVTLTQMTPTFAGLVTVTVCQLVTGGCVPTWSGFAQAGRQATSGVIQVGNYRVIVSDDLRTLTTAENYTITVNHP